VNSRDWKSKALDINASQNASPKTVDLLASAQNSASQPSTTPQTNNPATEEPVSLTAIHVLLRYLEGEGVTCMFGIPGGPLMPLYEAIFERGTIRPILTKHEEGASFMADGYARVSGRLGVCCTTTGPGATNALTGVACARRDSVPILLLTAQVATGAFGKGAAQESSPLAIDIVDMYKAVTKASAMLVAPDKMAEMVRHLLRLALSGRPGPIHLSLPADMVKTPIAADIQAPANYRPQGQLFDRSAVKEASKLLLRAQRPVILAGYGVHLSRAYGELRAFAERLRIPVASTPKGKGVFPEDHVLSLGVFGLGGSPQSEAALFSKDTDLLLVVGSSLGEEATQAWDPRLGENRFVLQVDVDPTEIARNYPVEVALVGDAGRILTELTYQVERDVRWMDPEPDLEPRLAHVKSLKSVHNRFLDPASVEDTSVPIKPQRVIGEIRQAIPDDGILFCDIGTCMAWALHYYIVKQPGTFFVNMGFSSMGHAVAAAIGGKLATDRPVVALVGDAAFAMNGMEVHTAVENNIPVIWVVLNNGGNGLVHLGEVFQFRGKFNTSLFQRRLDVARMAEGLGAAAFRAEQPGDVAQAIRRALVLGRPTVIDVQIDPEIFPPVTSRLKTLDRFFNKG
jgi:acetolactate synthase I/II/III large subunit